jgi:hypothetical protein
MTCPALYPKNQVTLQNLSASTLQARAAEQTFQQTGRMLHGEKVAEFIVRMVPMSS